MTTPTEQIALQNKEYHKSFLLDVQFSNDEVIRMMDETVIYKHTKNSSNRLEAMNSFSPEQRRRLMSGEKLEEILGHTSTIQQSKYYNSSNEAVQSIPQDDLFMYQIGDHLMAFETNDLEINEDLKTINMPVVVYDNERQDWKDMNYTIHNEDVFNILQYQLNSPRTPSPIQSHSPHSLHENLPFVLDVNPEANQSNEHIVTNASPPMRKIQEKLFDQLLSIYQGTTIYSAQVYTVPMELRIQQMLDDNLFPFQIVNNLIAEFTE